MAEQSDTVYAFGGSRGKLMGRVVVQLIAYPIAADCFPTHLERCCRTRFRPYKIWVLGGSVLSVPGMKDIDKVNVSVVVPVIVAEVDAAFYGMAGILYQLSDICVFVGTVLTIIAAFLGKGDRTDNDKLRRELSAAHVLEVLSHTAIVAFLVIAVIRQRSCAGIVVEIIIEALYRVRKRELHVAELRQNDQYFRIAAVRKVGWGVLADSSCLRLFVQSS